MARGKYKRKRALRELHAATVAELGLPAATENLLASAGIRTLAVLTSLTVGQLKKLPGLGETAFAAICDKLSQRGIALREDCV